jgi:hypothetical protein
MAVLDKFFKRPRRWWYVFLCVVVPMPFYWMGHPNREQFKTYVRRHGVILEVLGLWLVYRGLIQTAKLFEVPTPWAAAQAWLDDLNKKEPPVHIVSASATGLSQSRSGAATATADPVNPTDTQRIEYLERIVKDFKMGMDRVEQFATQKFKSVDSQIQSVAAELNKEINEVKAKVHDQSAGSLGESFMGLAWVAAGTLLCDATSEVADLLGWVVKLF